MSQKPALLVLADGTLFQGVSVGAQGMTVGELVFNTAMTGYQEILSDPSYARQIITLTTAHVGNTGCTREDMESSRAWAAGVVMRDCALQPSNYRAEVSFPDWLIQQGVIGISGIDTRALTLKLRDEGAMGACITTEVERVAEAQAAAIGFKGLNGADLASSVTRSMKETWHEGRGSWGKQSKPQTIHVVAYDFGVKQGILRILYDLGCHVTLVPARTGADEVLALHPDGVFLSNGPGDPLACTEAIAAVKTLLETNLPIFGICLGFQLLGLACGATSLKMKFGHHGANHPVIDLKTNRVFITSQNHGFAIDEASLPSSLLVTHRSLFDGSLQGIMHREKQAFGFQGHPEASPGPHDIEPLFEQFITACKSSQHKEF